MEYRIFDAHSDTVSKIYEKHQSLDKNTCHIDFDRMKSFSNYTQVFAAFIDKKSITASPGEQIKKIIEKYNAETKKCGITHIMEAGQLESCKYSSILAIEGGEALEGSMENLDRFYQSGVRILTLTWNYRNELCDGIGEEDGKGLTEFGKNVVGRMNELGMIVDVSHISEKGFWDVADICRKPFIASHSNAKSLCGHKRNLTDAQIKMIIETGGVIGVNFYPVFLDDTGRCKIEKIIEHIEYILDMGGENSVGLGSDFDGIDLLPEGMTGIESMKKLMEIMEKRNYGKTLTDRILWGNFSRVININFS